MRLTPLSASASALVLLTACGGGETPAPSSETEAPPTPATASDFPPIAEVSAANYSLERTHAFLTWKVGHSGGLSSYRVAFTDYDADLQFDPETPENSSLTVTINPLSVVSNYPGDYKATHANSSFETWDEDIARSERWLNADAHPEITFTSTAIERTGEAAGTVTGELAFLGATRPITLNVTFNGHGNAPWFGERDLLGFDATTTLLRSDFGMSSAIPSISDEVVVEFSGEFLQDE